MLALRNLARSGPSAAVRLSTRTATRPQSSLFRQVSAFHPSWSQSAPRLAAGFHVSAARKQRDGNVNEELIAKLQSEINIEQDMREDENLSTNIKDYLESSEYKIEDKPGHQEVVLTRTYNDENISVTFTTADVNAPTEDVDQEGVYDQDADLETQSGGANTKGAVNQGATSDGNVRIAPEDRVAPADREELEDDYEDDGQQQGFPAHVNIRIERQGKGALSLEVTAQDGDIVIDDVFFFPSSELADPATAEQDWQRRTLYTGPPFNNLDEDLQILLEKYLEERGINTRMALFIPDYIDHKEQKEYVRWLNNVKSFVQ